MNSAAELLHVRLSAEYSQACDDPLVDSDGARAAATTIDQSDDVVRTRPSGEAVITLVSLGVFTGIGWLVGVWLLWTQRVWSRRDRIIGTAVPLVGLILAYICVPLWTAEEVCRNASSGQLVCTGGPTKLGDAVFLTALLGPPALTAAYLARGLMARRRD